MKRALIGGFFSLLGTIWGLAVIVAASGNPVTAWDPTIGRLMSTIIEMGLVFPLVLSSIFVLLGVTAMVAEYFRKD